MSLNDWSIILFSSTALLYITLVWSVFRRPSLPSFFVLIFVWFVSIGTQLVYGIATRQVGFVLMFFLNIALMVLVYTITERPSNDSQ